VCHLDAHPAATRLPWPNSRVPTGSGAPEWGARLHPGRSRAAAVRCGRFVRASGKTAEWTRTPGFRLVLPSRKSPNLSNSRACVAAHSLFLLKNILVECIRHNHGSKSAIQSPLNLPEEPSRLRLDGGSSASRSSRSTPSGELENSSTTRPLVSRQVDAESVQDLDGVEVENEFQPAAGPRH
jgi:hypothetical protein